MITFIEKPPLVAGVVPMENWIKNLDEIVIGYKTLTTKRQLLDELRGKDLACWCPLTNKDGSPHPCHADVLLEIVNGGVQPVGRMG